MEPQEDRIIVEAVNSEVGTTVDIINIAIMIVQTKTTALEWLW